MIEIPVGVNPETKKTLTVCSYDVSAVVFPCSSFESLALWRQLQERYKFKNEELIQPRMTKPFLVDWVNLLGEEKPIEICIWCWEVRGVWLCFVESAGDIFSYNLVESYLHGHFKCVYDKGSRRAFFDPMNFHNCVSALKEAIEKNQLQKCSNQPLIKP